ncbi:MAG: NAD(P)/FAD-dependent oxidoreductase [Pseudoramibacter sp.]
MHQKVIVIGGGPAGMTAAIASASCGEPTVLLEKNEKLGKKLFITGKGRCNLTNDCDQDTFLKNVVHHSRFMYSSISRFDHERLMALIEDKGCRLKVERGHRVFPVSDKSSDVIKAFERALDQYGVDVHLNTPVQSLVVEDGSAVGVKLENGRTIPGKKIIVATGGLSYRSTGSDGWGLKTARLLGHDVVPCRPSLVGLKTKEDWPKKVQGIALKNVEVTLARRKKKIRTERGEMLLTHFGVSGPLILTDSAYMDRPPEEYRLILDFKPALSEKQLDQRIQREINANENKQIVHAVASLLPKKLIPVLLDLAGIDKVKKANQMTKAERHRLIDALKHQVLTVEDFCDINTAIVTSGGVNVKDIDPKTMASKKIAHLYFAGEVIDVDALTGGFNIQIAATTGFAAGMRSE